MSRTGFFTKEIVQNILKASYRLDCVSFSENRLGVMGFTATVKTKAQKFVLKLFKPSRKRELVFFDVSVMDYLSSNGLPTPRIISGVNDKRIFKFGKQYGVVLEHVSGKHKSKKSVTKTELKSLAETIAKMHLLLKKFEPNGKKEHQDLFYLDYAAKFQKQNFPTLKKLFLTKTQKRLFKRICGKNLDNTIHFCKQELEHLKKQMPKTYESNKKGIIHHDINFDNLLFRDNQLVALLDFDESTKGFWLSDLAIITGELTKEQKKYFLKKYSEKIPLSKEEIKLIPILRRHYKLLNLMWTLLEFAKYLRNEASLEKVNDYINFCHRFLIQS